MKQESMNIVGGMKQLEPAIVDILKIGRLDHVIKLRETGRYILIYTPFEVEQGDDNE